MNAGPRHLSRAERGREIETVEARLLQRRADARRHAAAVGDRLSEVMTSPLTLIGAAGIGAAVAWYYPRRKAEVEPPGEEGRTSALATIMSGLNLAGMMLSLFPAHGNAGPQEESADPR